MVDKLKNNITKDKCDEYIYKALCSGLYLFEKNGFELSYDKKEYAKCKEYLKSTLDYSICYEDVLLYMLKNNHTIRVVNSGYMINEKLNIQNAYDKIPTLRESIIYSIERNICSDDYYFHFLQVVLLNKIIYNVASNLYNSIFLQ